MKMKVECQHSFVKETVEDYGQREVCRKCSQILIHRQEFLDLHRNQNPPQENDPKKIILDFCRDIKAKSHALKGEGITDSYDTNAAIRKVVFERFGVRIYQILT